MIEVVGMVLFVVLLELVLPVGVGAALGFAAARTTTGAVVGAVVVTLGWWFCGWLADDVD